jgi:hypothetical protein
VKSSFLYRTETREKSAFSVLAKIPQIVAVNGLHTKLEEAVVHENSFRERKDDP